MTNYQWLELQNNSILKYSRTITGRLKRSMLEVLKNKPKAVELARKKWADRGLYQANPTEVNQFIIEQYFDIE